MSLDLSFLDTCQWHIQPYSLTCQSRTLFVYVQKTALGKFLHQFVTSSSGVWDYLTSKHYSNGLILPVPVKEIA